MLQVAFECSLTEAHRDVWQVEQVLDIGSVLWFNLEHPADDALEFLGVTRGHALEVALFYFEC